MKYKIIKTLILILFVISFVISIYNIRSTLAKYQELVDTDYQVGIRKWLILVDGKDIQNEETVMSETITPYLVENEHMKEGAIVPGREGYFEIDLDYTKTDVPFTYSFEIEQTNQTKLEDIEFFGYSIEDQGSEFLIDSTTDEISYIGMEEVEEIANTLEETGERRLEVSKLIIDAETNAEKKLILTASLAFENEESEEENEEEAEEQENKIQKVGKIATVTSRIIDSTTESEIEPEKVIFLLTQELDTETNKTRYTIVQPIDPTGLENYRRYQNLRVYFRWKDTEDNKMDNLADTKFRGEDNTDPNIENTILKYQANIKFKQYVQE